VIDAILDTGPLVGSLDRDDQWHGWAAKQFASIQQPALTCEAVISEACFLLRDVPETRQKIFTLVERGILRVVPVLPDESPAVRILLARYGKRMDYADACLVRLSELYREHTVVTTDAEDFRIYRRFIRQSITLRAP
jgi:predicted nucleic acid-binding protein